LQGLGEAMILEPVLSRHLSATRSWQRSLAKTLTWRLFATVDTFVISLLVTRKLTWAGSIVGVEIFTKMMLYFAHERVWALSRAGVSDLRRHGAELHRGANAGS
jgi:uncharacterized membrane protein